MVSAIDPTKPADSVPARKADMRKNFLAAKREIEALQKVKGPDGVPIDMKYQRLTRPLLVWYTELVNTPKINNNTVVLSLKYAVHKIILTKNVAELIVRYIPRSGSAVSLALIVTQDSVGGRTLTWPSSIRWANGVVPSVSTSPNATDIFTLVTIDRAATWYGFVGGQAFS